MKKRIGILLAAAALACGSAQAAVQTLKAEVNGMVCAFCAQGIDKKLRALPATKDVYINLEQRIVAVEVKEGQTLAPETIKELVKEAGYDVVSIVPVAQTASAIKASVGK